jgi:hypothetical protein
VGGRLVAGRLAGWPSALPGRWSALKIGSWVRAIQFSEIGDPISDPIFRSNLLLHFAAEVCSTKLDHKIGSQIGSSNSGPYFGPMFDPILRSNFTIQIYDPILRSNFTIQFVDPILRSIFTIQFYDPFVRSNFSIQFFDPIFRSNFPARRPAEHAAWQLASRPAGQRGRSASQQTATQPASHPASPAASPQLATAAPHRSLILGNSKEKTCLHHISQECLM